MGLIGISGKLGSGKDTVGQIIQFLTAEDVGPECIKRIRGGLSIEGHHNSTFQNKKFAGKLKAVGSLLTSIPVEKFEDQDFKKTDLPNEWCYIENGYAAKNMTVREFLQKLGTDAMRNGLHTNVWINALYADYTPEIKPGGFERVLKDLNGLPYGHEYEVMFPDWILTDMRFPNELESVKERNGITIRVNRPHGYTNPHTGEYKEVPLDYHPSETALDDAEFDYVIENTGSIQDLIEEVRRILLTEKII